MRSRGLSSWCGFGVGYPDLVHSASSASRASSIDGSKGRPPVLIRGRLRLITRVMAGDASSPASLITSRRGPASWPRPAAAAATSTNGQRRWPGGFGRGLGRAGVDIADRAIAEYVPPITRPILPLIKPLFWKKDAAKTGESALGPARPMDRSVWISGEPSWVIGSPGSPPRPAAAMSPVYG